MSQRDTVELDPVGRHPHLAFVLVHGDRLELLVQGYKVSVNISNRGEMHARVGRGQVTDELRALVAQTSGSIGQAVPQTRHTVLPIPPPRCTQLAGEFFQVLPLTRGNRRVGEPLPPDQVAMDRPSGFP